MVYPLLNVPEAPEAGAVNTTGTPDRGVPLESAKVNPSGTEVVPVRTVCGVLEEYTVISGLVTSTCLDA